MPVDPNAAVRISAFNWVPPFAQGQVRDLRPRWALEEAGMSYAVRKLDAMAERPADYYQEQPFGRAELPRRDRRAVRERRDRTPYRPRLRDVAACRSSRRCTAG